jgi:hypothetical protein
MVSKDTKLAMIGKTMIWILLSFLAVGGVSYRNSNKSVWEWILLIVCSFLVVGLGLTGISVGWKHISSKIFVEKRNRSRKLYWSCIFVILIPRILLLLHLWPGTLSCDTPGQLMQAMFDSPFENLNPLIQTLFLTVFVQIGKMISSVSAGITLYTVFQLLSYALVSAYTIHALWKKGICKPLLLVFLLFFALNPVNLEYSVGMWKDTFFAVAFLAVMTFVYDHLDEKLSAKSRILFISLVFICSLSRNSAWSAFIFFFVVLFLFSVKTGKNHLKTISIFGTIAVVSGLLVQFILYPFLGISNSHSYFGISIPMQQMARTIKDNDIDQNTEGEIKKYCKDGVELHDIAEAYNYALVDPIRAKFNSNVLKQDMLGFLKLWLKLGARYPKSYMKAFIDHTIPIWWPGEGTWQWDNRIFENAYGVVRESKITHSITEIIQKILKMVLPGYTIINRGGMVLWFVLIGMFLNLNSGNTLGNIFYMPFLIIFAGLLLFSFAPLFRYMYAAFVVQPLFCGFQTIPVIPGNTPK